MRRSSSLAVTSAIVMIGGLGVFRGSALSLRAAGVTNHPQSVRAIRHTHVVPPPDRRTTRPASLLRNDSFGRTLPYLVVSPPRSTGQAAAAVRPREHTRTIATPTQWRALRTCESGDSYGMDTGNGYYGAYQFAPTTWWALGYRGLPNTAPARVQDRAARRLERVSGWSAWPVCSVIVGLSTA
jgi:hypothetical protein